jgi:hypothetical protein
MCGEKRRELARPHRFLVGGGGYADGVPHKGIVPDTGVCRNLPPSIQVSLPNERRMAEERWGVRFTHSTLRRESRSHGEGVDNVA